MDCRDGDHWDYFVPHVAEVGQENFLDGKSWATVYVSQFHRSCSKTHRSHSVGEVDTDEFDFTIPDGYGHGEANEFLGQEDNMDEDNEGTRLSPLRRLLVILPSRPRRYRLPR